MIDILTKHVHFFRNRFLGVVICCCCWFNHILHCQIEGLTETLPEPAAITEKTILKLYSSINIKYFLEYFLYNSINVSCNQVSLDC